MRKCRCFFNKFLSWDEPSSERSFPITTSYSGKAGLISTCSVGLTLFCVFTLSGGSTVFLFPPLLHSNTTGVWDTIVATPHGGEGAGMTVNFMIVLRHLPAPSKHTSSSIFPNGLTCSPENPDIVVCVSTSFDRIDGCNMLKHCSNIISIEAPSSMCILRTMYPSTSSSTTKASSERSRAGTGGKIIATFIHSSSVIVVFLFRSGGCHCDSVCQIQGLSLTATLGGSNHLCCALFHCDSHNTCSSFLCWVPPLTTPIRASLTDVPLPESPAGCLIVNPRLRLLLDGGTIDGGVVVVHTGRDVLVLWR
ncbi:hypothetical protein Tco_0499621 [Tanacetum coccineum]